VTALRCVCFSTDGVSQPLETVEKGLREIGMADDW
jgi:hypothetical protein